MKKIILFCLSIGFCLSAAAGEKVAGIAAIVNDEIITFADWQHQYRQVKKDLQRNQIELPTDKQLKSQVLQHMVEVELQVQEAKRYGIELTENAVSTAIKNIAIQNHLSLKQLKQKLFAEGFDFNTYKKNIRQQMLLNHVQKKVIGDRIRITPQQINNEYQFALKQQGVASEFHLQDILIPVSDAPTSREMIQAKQKAVRVYQDLKKGKSFDSLALAESADSSALQGGDLGWRTLNAMPKLFASHVKTLTTGQFSKPISTPNGFHIIKLVKKRNAIEPHMVTLTRARHILIRASEPQYDKQAHARIQVLEKELKQGAAFEKLAREFSEDTGSAEKGGDLGWVQAKDVVPTFANAMTHLKIKQVSAPVRSPFGWHIIQVLARKQKDDSLDLFKNKIAEQLYQREFETRIKDWLQTLHTKAYIVLNA